MVIHAVRKKYTNTLSHAHTQRPKRVAKSAFMQGTKRKALMESDVEGGLSVHSSTERNLHVLKETVSISLGHERTELLPPHPFPFFVLFLVKSKRMSKNTGLDV